MYFPLSIDHLIMKLLLIISAVFEALVGISLLVLPAITTSALLGVALDTPAGFVAARIAGAALVALALACWNARDGERAGPALGVVTAMLFYNFAAAAVLVWAGIRLELRSPMLWPTIVLHLALGVWCLISVKFAKKQNTEE